MQTVNWRGAGVVMLALLAAPVGADVILTISLRPPTFAQFDNQVAVTVTVRDPQGTALPLEDVTLARVGTARLMAGVTGAEGRVAFAVTHDSMAATSYEYAARCRGVEQRVTIPVMQPAPPPPDQPPPDPHESAVAFLLDSPGTGPPADALADLALLGAIRQGLSDIADALRDAGTFAAIVGGPAHALFVDAQGRRVGTVAGQAVNEVPGAEVITTGEAEWYRLPASAQYQLTIEGTDAGFGTLTLLSPDPLGLAIRAFEDIPLDVGSRASVPIMNGGDAQAVLTAGGLVPPAASGVIDVSSAAWTGQAQAAETPPGDLAGGSVIERAVFCTGEDADGRLVGVGTTFPVGTVQVGLYLHIKEAPPGTELDLTWTHEGDVLRRQIIEAEGTASSLTYLVAVNKPQLWQGDYAVVFKQNDRHIGTLNFAVR